MLLHNALSNIGRQFHISMSEMRRIFCCLAVVSVLLATDPLVPNAAAQRRYRWIRPKYWEFINHVLWKRSYARRYFHACQSMYMDVRMCMASTVASSLYGRHLVCMVGIQFVWEACSLYGRHVVCMVDM